MVRNAALGLLTLASLIALGALLVPHPASGIVFASASLLFPPALAALGASRRGGLGTLGPPLLLFALLLQLLLAAMLLLSGRAGDGGLWLGLPPAAAVLLYGLGLLPLFLVSFGFAWHFGRSGPREEELRRLRELARRAKDRGEPEVEP
jgi:hypothetical protein